MGCYPPGYISISGTCRSRTPGSQKSCVSTKKTECDWTLNYGYCLVPENLSCKENRQRERIIDSDPLQEEAGLIHNAGKKEKIWHLGEPLYHLLQHPCPVLTVNG